MARRLNRFHPHAPKFHFCTIRQRREFVLRLRLCAQIDLCAELIAQFKMPRHKVRVQVRQKNVFDVELVFRGKREIDADVALWVDHGRLARLLIANQIRSMSQAAQIKLFEDQGRNPHKNFDGGSVRMPKIQTDPSEFTSAASRREDTASMS